MKNFKSIKIIQKWYKFIHCQPQFFDMPSTSVKNYTNMSFNVNHSPILANFFFGIENQIALTWLRFSHFQMNRAHYVQILLICTCIEDFASEAAIKWFPKSPFSSYMLVIVMFRFCMFDGGNKGLFKLTMLFS